MRLRRRRAEDAILPRRYARGHTNADGKCWNPDVVRNYRAICYSDCGIKRWALCPFRPGAG